MHSKADRLHAALLVLFRDTKKPVTAPRLRRKQKTGLRMSSKHLRHFDVFKKKKKKKSVFRPERLPKSAFQKGKVRDEERRRETAVLVSRATVSSKKAATNGITVACSVNYFIRVNLCDSCYDLVNV